MRSWLPPLIVLALLSGSARSTRADPITINFDDVVGSEVDITNRYAALGVTLNATANPFPLSGPFPAPATLPTILGGVTTWTQGFPSATSAPQVAVAEQIPGTTGPGNGGILISFAFDVTSVSLVGNDLGVGLTGADNESVTLTAYDALGLRIGQTFHTLNLPGGFDRTAASISLPGMRFVAFNYTDTQFGFHAIDDLVFTPAEPAAAVPEPATLTLVGAGALGLLAYGRQRRSGNRHN
jgi:hypothetical protein